MKKYSNEFKVGIFFIVCVLAFIYLVVSTGKLDIKQGGYHIYVVFDEIAGLDVKAPVMLNGREVGKVENIEISYKNNETKNVLKIWIAEEAKIRQEAQVSIKTLGLMGEKYVQIAANKGDQFLEAGAILIGKSYMDLDILMEQDK